MVAARGQGMWEWTASGYRVPLREDEKVLEMGAQLYECMYLMPLNCTPKNS